MKPTSDTAPWDRAEASSSSQQPPPRHQPEVEPVRDAWEEVSIPSGAQQHTFVFHKPDNTMCRSVLLAEERDVNSYPHSIDETPKFVDNPSSGTAPIEHYVRRLVTYLARLQSVTQNSEKGLNLKAYVKLDTKQWLRMYSRIHHACEIAACVHLPDPIMLTAAAMVRSDSDLSVDSDPERSNKALRAIRNVQTEMGLGGKPDAAAARAQITILATDFDMCANNRVTRSNMTLGQTLRNKGWGELIHVNPCFMNSYTCDDSMGVLTTVVETIRGMDEIQASTVTLHFSLVNAGSRHGQPRMAIQ